jgi:ubiquinone/menaquinone biosynthesis C-methylase UbiE
MMLTPVQAFAPYATSVIGMDISLGMVNVYNHRASDQGLSPSEMKAIQGDLFATPESEEIDKPELWDFDLVAVGLAFHHFDDEVLAAKRLVKRVKKGTGKVLIIDFLPHEHIGGRGHSHGHHHQHGRDHSQETRESKKTFVIPKEHAEKAAHTVKYMGFSEERMKEIFEDAGCVDVKIDILGTGITTGLDGSKLDRTVFLCVATRKE